MTKEEEAIENLTKLLKQRDEKQVKITTYNLFENIETVLSMLKQNSAEIKQKNTELAEKSAEIEKKDKIIDLMAERIEWLCKSNGILLDKEHDENFTQEDIKQYFERKVNE